MQCVQLTAVQDAVCATIVLSSDMSSHRASEEEEKNEEQHIARDHANASTTSSSTVDVVGALRLVIEWGWVERVGSLQVTSLECLVACRDVAHFRLKVAQKTPRRVWHPKLCQANVPSSAPPLFQFNRYYLPVYDKHVFDMSVKSVTSRTYLRFVKHYSRVCDTQITALYKVQIGVYLSTSRAAITHLKKL